MAERVRPQKLYHQKPVVRYSETTESTSSVQVPGTFPDDRTYHGSKNRGLKSTTKSSSDPSKRQQYKLIYNPSDIMGAHEGNLVRMMNRILSFERGFTM
jgi:hypothetical protein